MYQSNSESTLPANPLAFFHIQHTGLQTIKEIERLYEAASKEQGITAKYSTEWKEFERYTDALPQEAWIQ